VNKQRACAAPLLALHTLSAYPGCACIPVYRGAQRYTNITSQGQRWEQRILYPVRLNGRSDQMPG